MAQRMSVALHMAAAWEIARELSLAGAEDESALFGGGVADSALPKFASYLPRARAPWRRLSVAVFPCVGVCVNPVCTQCIPSVATRVVAKIHRPFFFRTRLWFII